MQFKLPLLLMATFFIDSIWTKDCTKLKSNTKLFCYFSDIQETENFCQCTHIVLPEGTELKIVEKIRKQNGDVKILVTVSEFNEKLVSLLKGSKVDGVELNLRKIDSKNDLTDFISTVKSKLGSEHYIAVSVPSKTESLAKNFDFKELSKHADVFVLNTAFLGASQNVTFHPSRLSGLWDMQNTDSMVDLVSGLGAPLSKIVIAAPVQAFSFTLQNEEYTAPGSPATEVKSITRKELCDFMQQKGTEWTLERDQDQAGPYIFRGKQWIAFEDETSIDIKTKYARVRSLAGVALKDLSQDSETKCGSSMLNAAFKGLSKQARAPRGAVLHTLEREILSPSSTHSSSVHDSPFRISRIIDTEGKIHVVRQDTRTEFECSRQGYFVHPRSCNRFYRCVKFDQRTEEYNVFEFDCPAGLTFDEKTEVCVWPGSLPHASACSGSSEIAPVPQKRFSCPTEPGYYADPENCRWFFACLDHGEPSMQAYEFRCPFGLVFDEEKLLCEWPWLVPKCGLASVVTLNHYGGVSTNINQYEGLGVLQTVKLGGLQGPIQAAEAKTYSNVGFVGDADKLNDGRIFSENSARFIDASRRLGLSLKATQSLYNAGLLSEKLAAIGLNQNDFGLGSLASEVNIGLHQNAQGFGQQLNGFEFGKQLIDQQNQAYEYAGQNFNVLSSGQSLQGLNDKLVLVSGSGLSEQSGTFGVNTGKYTTQSNINQLKDEQEQRNSGLYNFYQQNNERVQLDATSAEKANVRGALQYQQEKSRANAYSSSFANAGQISLGHLDVQQHNIDLGQYQQAQLGLGQQTLQNEDVNQVVIDGKLQQFNNLGSKSYSTSYINSGQTSQGQLSSQVEITDQGRNQHTQSELGQLTLLKLHQNDFNRKNIGGEGQYQNVNNGISGTSYTNYVNLGATSQGKLNVEQSAKAQLGIGRLNTGYGGQSQGLVGEYDLNTREVQNNRPLNDNLRERGYSSSYFNSESSGSHQQNIGRSQEVQSAQNIDELNVGLGGYRQNSGLLLQNVEINGAAGTYTDDIHHSNSNTAVDSVDFTHVTPASVSHKTASSFESIVSATPLKTIDNYKQKQSVDTAGLEYTINNLEETQPSVRLEQNSGRKAESYQYIQKEQPLFVSSTPSSIIVQQNTQKLSAIGLNSQPKVSFNAHPLGFVSSTPRPFNKQVNFETVSRPAVTLQERAEVTYSQAPVVSYASVGEQGLLSGQGYSQDGGYTFEKPTIAFEEKPLVSISSTPSFDSEKVSVTPSSATSYSYSNRASDDVRYQKVLKERPQIFLQQPRTPVGKQGILSGQAYSQDGGYRYEKPTIAFEDKPQISISSTPSYESEKISVTPSSATSYSYSNIASGDVKYQERLKDSPQILLQQPQVVIASPASTGSSSSYFRQDKSKITYQTPQVIQQQPQESSDQKLLSSYNYVKPEISRRPQTLLVQQPQVTINQPQVVATSYNYVNQQQPQVTVEQPQLSTRYNYVKPGVKNEVIVEQPQVVLKNPQAVVTSFKYDRPTVQSQIVYQQPQITVKQPVSVVENYNYVKPQIEEVKPVLSQSFSYTQQHARGSYKYEVPQVTVQGQPQVIKTVFQKPSVSSSFNTKTDYKYKRPSVVFQEGPKLVQQTIHQNLIQPVIQDQLLIQKQINRPVVQKEDVTSYQYFQPVVQQPRGFTTFQQEAVKTYSYSNPVRTQYVAKPATITTTNYRTPVFKNDQIEFKGYGYPKPQVQFVEEPEPIITNYENKVPVVEAPIVPKKAYLLGNSFQYQKRIPTVQVLKKQPIYSTPRPTFISTINSVVSQKASPVPQREFIYYDSRLDNTRQNQYFQASTVKTTNIPIVSYSSSLSQNVENEGYQYPKPDYQFEEAPRTSNQQPYQYYQSNQEVQQRPIQIQPQIVRFSTPRPTFVSTMKSIVRQKVESLEDQFITTPPAQIQYLESTTLKPVSTVTTSYLPSAEQKIKNVEINGYIDQKPQVQSYQYTQQTAPQKQVVVENFVQQNYDRSSHYTTERPIKAQKLTTVAQEYFYYDSRLTSTPAPEVKYIETSTSVPIAQKTERVAFEGYNYPKPQVAFEEPKTVITSYENRAPVVEPQIVPKKAYITTGQSYTYNNNANIEQQSVKPIVLENYVAQNYQEHSLNSQLAQIDYVTPRPTYSSTVAAVIAQKFVPLQPDFKYVDSRYSSTPRTRLTSQNVVVSSARGYSYSKPKVQLLEEPQPLLSTIEVKKEAQPVILENYVSPAYQKYDVSLQSTTQSTILDQNVQQGELQYDRRSRPRVIKVTQAPLNLEVSTPASVIVQKLEQEQPREPFFYYDSRLSSTQSPQIEIVQQKDEAPEVYRQDVTSYDSRYSSSSRPAVELKSRPSVTVIEEERPSQKIVDEQYSLEASTEGQSIIYADIKKIEPTSTYLPIRKRVKITKPSRKYLPSSTTPSSEYLPSSTPATISNEYLPISSSEAPSEGSISVENYENFELVRKKTRPVKVVKIVRPRVKTIVVKKNDFNPFLSAKLGAQCTCTSNTIELRKEPLRIEVTDDDDYDNDDGILVEKKDGEAFVVESYESGKLGSVTDEPEVYIKSSTVDTPSSTYRLQKVNRGRTRAQNVVVEDISTRRKSRINVKASDVNIVASRVRVKTPRIDIETDDDSEINVESGRSRTNLARVESDENIEINSRNFDRYGPGGLRSATETLQGIDCQRAGLFRHPTQCNKFYSCRWDCKKNKFTLHVFNCPVHLTFDNNLGACNWPSQGPACLENTLLPSE